MTVPFLMLIKINNINSPVVAYIYNFIYINYKNVYKQLYTYILFVQTLKKTIV